MHLVRSKSVALIKTGQALSLRPDILKSKIWAEELGKLVDEVDSCPDIDAMNILREELSDLLPRIKNAKRRMEESNNSKQTTTASNHLHQIIILVSLMFCVSLQTHQSFFQTVSALHLGIIIYQMLTHLVLHTMTLLFLMIISSFQYMIFK